MPATSSLLTTISPVWMPTRTLIPSAHRQLFVAAD
jgi:hypothetical protein